MINLTYGAFYVAEFNDVLVCLCLCFCEFKLFAIPFSVFIFILLSFANVDEWIVTSVLLLCLSLFLYSLPFASSLQLTLPSLSHIFHFPYSVLFILPFSHFIFISFCSSLMFFFLFLVSGLSPSPLPHFVSFVHFFLLLSCLFFIILLILHVLVLLFLLFILLCFLSSFSSSLFC